MYRDWFGDASVFLLDLPLACCAIETQIASDGELRTELPKGAKLVVTLSGTITRPLVPALRQCLAELPKDAVVVAFGSCASAGGPYWDAYSVVPGASELGIAVDQFISGCPPPPEALERVLEAQRNG